MLKITKDYRNIEWGWAGGFSEAYVIYHDFLNKIYNRKGIDKDWTSAITEKCPVYIRTIFEVLHSYECQEDEFVFKVIPSYEEFQSRFLAAVVDHINVAKEECLMEFSDGKKSLARELAKLQEVNAKVKDYQTENKKIISSFADNKITGYNSLDEEIINAITKVLENYNEKTSFEKYNDLINKNIWGNPYKKKDIMSNEKIKRDEDLEKYIDTANIKIKEVIKKHNLLVDEYNGLDEYLKRIEKRIDEIKTKLKTLDNEQKQALEKIESSMNLEYQHLNFFAQFKGSEVKFVCEKSFFPRAKCARRKD